MSSNVSFLMMMMLAPLSGMSRRRGGSNIIHAITAENVAKIAAPNKTMSRRRTVTAACGAQVAVVAMGDSVGLWPPRVKGIPGAFPRCPECYEKTGKPRLRKPLEARR
jgi:hypothetical protein